MSSSEERSVPRKSTMPLILSQYWAWSMLPGIQKLKLRCIHSPKYRKVMFNLEIFHFFLHKTVYCSTHLESLCPYMHLIIKTYLIKLFHYALFLRQWQAIDAMVLLSDKKNPLMNAKNRSCTKSWVPLFISIFFSCKMTALTFKGNKPQLQHL